MNSLFVILASLLAVAMCQGDHGCCIPETITAHEAVMVAEVVDGKPKITSGGIGLYMDNTIGMINYQIDLTVDQKQITKRVLQDFNTKTQYLIQNGRCTKTTIYDWKPICFTDDTFMGNLYFGSSTASLDASSYRMVDGNITTYVTVTSEKSCIPIGQWAYGQSQGAPVSMSLVISNVTRFIPDPSVFDVPAICNTVPLTDQFQTPIPILRGSYLFR